MTLDKKKFDWTVPAICGGLAVITIIVFGQTLGFNFINCDDDLYVYDNARVAAGLGLKNVAWFFGHPDCSLYHPLTMLSLAADYQFHGPHPGWYHLTNVLLHTGSVVLLFLVLRQMTGALWRSAFVAALFAVHPLRAESVAWVSERKDVLSGFFFMLTLAAYVSYVRRPNSLARYLTVVVAFVMALLSKPTAVTLPFLLLLLDYWPLQRRETLRRLAAEKIPLAALAAGACWMTISAAGKAIATTAPIPMTARLSNALVSYAIYLRQMVWPEDLAAFYPQPQHGYSAWAIAGSALLLVLVTAAVLAVARQRRWLLTGWFWYLGMLLPMIGLVKAGDFSHADRMTYLPQIGICLAAVWLAAEWQLSRAVMAGLMAGVLAVLLVCAWKQTAYWRNNEILWTRTLACTSDNAIAHCNLGLALSDAGKLDQAIDQYETAVAINPRGVSFQNDLASALLDKGKVDEAIAHERQALQIQPTLAEGHYNLGRGLFQKGEVNEAIAEYQLALQLKSNSPAAHLALATALRKKGGLAAAIAEYEAALAIAPGFGTVQNDLGTALRRAGRVEEAVVHLRRAAEILPDNETVHFNLAGALLEQGSAEEAMIEYQSALQIAPQDAEALNNLAWLLATCKKASLRNGGQAVQLAQRANELTGGTNAVILGTLAAALAETKQFPQAVETVQRALRLAGTESNAGLAERLRSQLKIFQSGRPL